MKKSDEELREIEKRRVALRTKIGELQEKATALRETIEPQLAALRNEILLAEHEEAELKMGVKIGDEVEFRSGQILLTGIVSSFERGNFVVKVKKKDGTTGNREYTLWHSISRNLSRE